MMARLPLLFRTRDLVEQLIALEDNQREHGARITKLERTRDSDAALQSQALVAALEKIAAAIEKNALDQKDLNRIGQALDANTAGIVEAQREKT